MGRGRGILKDMLMRRGGLTGSIARNGAGASYQTPAGLYVWDFTLESPTGYLHQKTDLYGGGWNVESTSNVDDYPVETNDAETMVDVYQSGAAAAYQGWGYSDPEQGLAKIKFRLQCDISASDSGHRVQVDIRDTLTGSTDYLHFYAMGTGILQCWRWNGSSNQVLINVSGLNGSGPRTVMGYITGTHVYMKGKNGYDDSYSWTTWNTDVNGNGAFTFDMSDKLWFLSNGNDTAPLTHGWVRKLEIMTPTYTGWAD